MNKRNLIRWQTPVATLLLSSTLVFSGWLTSALAKSPSILVQSTTSTANSGLYDHLLPLFTQASGITVHIVAVGTGQAIRNATNCDGDVLLVHAKSAENQFIAAGHGVERFNLMYNDFVFVGPARDPADIRGSNRAQAALKKIAQTQTLFASRGDDSGTHKKERALWQQSGVDPSGHSGKWYRETGSGMGATLNTAVGMGAYAMTDRATWLNFRNKGDFNIVVEGDKALFNQYGVMLVNPEKCSNVEATEGQAFIDWLRSNKGQSAIADYKVAGQQLFFPNAHSSSKSEQK